MKGNNDDANKTKKKKKKNKSEGQKGLGLDTFGRKLCMTQGVVLTAVLALILIFL